MPQSETPDKDPELQKILDLLPLFFGEAVPHNHALGLRLLGVEGDEVSAVLPHSDFLVGNPETGVLHGGAVTALLDATSGSAVYVKMRRMVRVATLDLRIDYLRPARPGRDITARAGCYKLTRSVAFVRALAHDGDAADPVASAQGTFIIMEDGT
ncbi:PaaI family thioesterase [Myxococcaceae bacterium GXIMD 01537]